MRLFCGRAGLATAMLACSVAAIATAPGQTNTNQTFVEIPLRLREGDLMISASINGSEPLSFKVDSGFGINMIHPDRVTPLNLRRAGQITIVGIAGEEAADAYAGAVYNFGGMIYEPRRVASLPSEARRRRRHRDGILGAGFFRRFVVEIDVANQRMRLHEPAAFAYHGTGQVLPLEFKRDTPIVEAVIAVPGQPDVRGRFEIDTGCDDGVCLGHEFVAANRLLESTNLPAGGVRRGVGGSAETRHGTLAELHLGRLQVEKPSANFFLEGSPAGSGQAGHIGMGVLARFRLIFDYSRKQIILEP